MEGCPLEVPHCWVEKEGRWGYCGPMAHREGTPAMVPKGISKYEARGGAAKSLQKVRYSHDAMIDLIVENPVVTQGELAAYFGYTPGWVSQIINSDAFRERLAERKDELVDPRIRTSIEDRIRALADKSIEVLLEKLHQTQNMNVAVRALDVAARSLGYGARPEGSRVQVNNYVALLPQREASASQWQQVYSPSAAPEVIEHAAVPGDTK